MTPTFGVFGFQLKSMHFIYYCNILCVYFKIKIAPFQKTIKGVKIYGNSDTIENIIRIP